MFEHAVNSSGGKEKKIRRPDSRKRFIQKTKTTFN